MSRSAAQLNIRSDTARRRVADLVEQTGKTATQVVEEALMAYRPPPPIQHPPAPPGLEWRGRFLVEAATPKALARPKMTLDEHLAALDDARDDYSRRLTGEDID